jgi:hypothetical protein
MHQGMFYGAVASTGSKRIFRVSTWSVHTLPEQRYKKTTEKPSENQTAFGDVPQTLQNSVLRHR